MGVRVWCVLRVTRGSKDGAMWENSRWGTCEKALFVCCRSLFASWVSLERRGTCVCVWTCVLFTCVSACVTLNAYITIRCSAGDVVQTNPMTPLLLHPPWGLTGTHLNKAINYKLLQSWERPEAVTTWHMLFCRMSNYHTRHLIIFTWQPVDVLKKTKPPKYFIEYYIYVFNMDLEIICTR